MRKTQTGYVTVMGMIILMALLMISTGMWLLVNAGTKVGRISRDALEAEYAAEAGAKRAVIEFFKGNSGNWGWLNSDRPYINDVNTKKYHVDVTPIPASPLSPNTYNIFSYGTVGSVKKTVSVSVLVTGGGGGANDVFQKYAAFSSTDLEVNSEPVIHGDIGSNGVLTVNSNTPVVSGAAYLPSPPQYIWNPQAVAGGYIRADPAGTLNVPGLVPAFPGYTPGGISLNTYSGSVLTAGSYIYNGDFSPQKIYTATGDVIIYINGNFTLRKTHGFFSSIDGTGHKVTIYVAKDFMMSDGAYIKAADLEIYAEEDIAIELSSSIQATNTLIQTKGSLIVRNGSTIDNTKKTIIYSDKRIEITNGSVITSGSGRAGLIVSKDYLEINTESDMSNTICVAGGKCQITNKAQIAGAYANGTLEINSTPKINYHNQLSAVIDTLGLNGQLTVTVIDGTWKTQ